MCKKSNHHRHRVIRHQVYHQHQIMMLKKSKAQRVLQNNLKREFLSTDKGILTKSANPNKWLLKSKEKEMKTLPLTPKITVLQRKVNKNHHLKLMCQ